MRATLDRGPDGELIRRAGVMAVVVAGGEVRAGDAIVVEAPAGKPVPLEPV
jgi:MOSC domain-containing protein YiiM